MKGVSRVSLGEKLAYYSIPEPNSGCVLWIGGIDMHGYGYVRWKGTKERRAHRFAWEMHNGPIPAGFFVCHRCDVRSCINPAHLFLGTAADNMADKAAKGRQSRFPGEESPMARLTEKEVIAIRNSSDTHESIAAKFGISRGHVGDIRNRIKWRHLK